MVGNRNHPLNQRHYDKDTLEEYVLGQLLPDEEVQVRQHVANCPLCRSTVVELHAFCQRMSSELHHELDPAVPGPQVSFDRIAAAWRKPPYRVTAWFKLQQLTPGASYMLLIALLTAAFILVFPSPDTAALDRLNLINTYDGPPAVVAAMTDDGLVVARLTPAETDILSYLAHVREPHNIQFSPDGQWLAFQDRSTLHIIQPMDDRVQIRVPVHDLADWRWSPDSQQLAYTNGMGQLTVFEVGTRIHRALVPAHEAAWGTPIWTDDSAQIAYMVLYPLPTEGRPQVRRGIWRISLDTGYRVELVRNTPPDDRLLIPVAWSRNAAGLLAFDMNAASDSQSSNLYRIHVSDHEAVPLPGYGLTHGSELAGPISSLDTTLAWQQGVLYSLNLTDGSLSMPLPEHIAWPSTFDWSPNGAWIAYTVAGSGQGLYIYAPQKAELRQYSLPGSAVEHAAYWAGAEHLFVVRQRLDAPTSELWMVPLTTHEPPQQIMTGIALPRSDTPWQDVLATQVIASD